MHDAQTDRPGPDTDRSPRIAAFALGPFQTNCYIVHEPDSHAAWIVDAGFDPAELIDFVRSQSLRPEALILTHAHADHIAGVDTVLEAFPNLPIHIHPAEREWLTDPHANLSAGMGVPVVCRSIRHTEVRDLNDADTLTLAGQPWRIAHTPGHSPGSISLINEPARIAIVGDALFNGSIGRTDFPHSDFDTLANSIRDKLYTLPPDTRVLPGHGPATTIARERTTNPFVPAVD